MVFKLAWPIYVLFFLPAVAFSNWLPRIPTIKSTLQLTDTVLGVCLTGAALGAIVVLPISSYIINLVGLNRTIFIVYFLFFPFFVFIGFANSAVVLFVILFIIGFSMSAFEVALNTKATEFEKDYDCRIMTTCHGFWSLGTIIGAFTGSLFAGWEVSTDVHFIIVTLVLILPGIYAGLSNPADTGKQQKPEKLITFPSISLLGLCIVTFVALSIEGAIMDWSAIYMSESLGEDPFFSGMAFTVFALTATIGRFSGDKLREFFPPRLLMIASGILTVLGLSISLFVENILYVLVGFAVSGLGLSLPYALAIVAAADRGDRPTAVNVASLSMLGFLAFLICPPLIGFTSDFVGLRTSLAGLIPLAICFIVLSTQFRPK